MNGNPLTFLYNLSVKVQQNCKGCLAGLMGSPAGLCGLSEMDSSVCTAVNVGGYVCGSNTLAPVFFFLFFSYLTAGAGVWVVD